MTEAHSELDLDGLLKGVTRIAHRAGEAIVEIYEQADVGVTTKSDDSPLTRADLASHKVIVSGLAELSPEIPVLSEEAEALPYSDRAGWQRFWLVDPLDGTKEFIKRNGEFTVNIALIEGGAPVMGVVYAPTLDRTFTGILGRGAWHRQGDAEETPIQVTGPSTEKLVVAASRSHAGPHLRAFLDHLPSHELMSMGSSLKLCLVAEARADLYPRLGPTMEWDTAAAHAVVVGAGGDVLDFDGRPLRYNKEDLLNPWFIVLGNRPVAWREAFAATGQNGEKD
ncbi:MAG: 3'(2'),5'-bisphosphate nucleotidase CysQ [Acidobacteriota bacterium]